MRRLTPTDLARVGPQPASAGRGCDCFPNAHLRLHVLLLSPNVRLYTGRGGLGRPRPQSPGHARHFLTPAGPPRLGHMVLPT